MTDVVDIFQKYSDAKSYTYHYGRKNVINLFGQGFNWSGNDTDIYFMHEFRKGTRIDNNTMSYTGNFYLVKHSTLNKNFYQEVGTKAEGKYENNIKPLIQAFREIESYYFCSDLDIKSLSFIDVTDLLDANLDGIKVDYTVQYINSYTGV